MPERAVKAPAPDGRIVDAHEVPVEESTERWTEVTLEDGTVFRIKPVVLKVTRLDDVYDSDRNPFYMVQSNAAITLVSVPDHLRQKVN